MDKTVGIFNIECWLEGHPPSFMVSMEDRRGTITNTVSLPHRLNLEQMHDLRYAIDRAIKAAEEQHLPSKEEVLSKYKNGWTELAL